MLRSPDILAYMTITPFVATAAENRKIIWVQCSVSVSLALKFFLPRLFLWLYPWRRKDGILWMYTTRPQLIVRSRFDRNTRTRFVFDAPTSSGLFEKFRLARWAGADLFGICVDFCYLCIYSRSSARHRALGIDPKPRRLVYTYIQVFTRTYKYFQGCHLAGGYTGPSHPTGRVQFFI